MWKTLLNEIKESGLSQAEIARHVGLSVGHLSDLITGKHTGSVRYEVGAAIVALHAQRCKPDQTGKAA